MTRTLTIAEWAVHLHEIRERKEREERERRELERQARHDAEQGRAFDHACQVLAKQWGFDSTSHIRDQSNYVDHLSNDEGDLLHVVVALEVLDEDRVLLFVEIPTGPAEGFFPGAVPGLVSIASRDTYGAWQPTSALRDLADLGRWIAARRDVDADMAAEGRGA